MIEDASLTFSSSLRLEGLPSFSISARFSPSAAAAARAYWEAFSASRSAARVWMSLAVGSSSSMFPDMADLSSPTLSSRSEQALRQSRRFDPDQAYGPAFFIAKPRFQPHSERAPEGQSRAG